MLGMAKPYALAATLMKILFLSKKTEIILTLVCFSLYL